jgi:hypothetical protein
LLPHVSSRAQCDEVIAGLLEVYDRTPEHHAWILDYSALSAIPMLLLWSTTAYADTLRKKSNKVYIAWLRYDLLCEKWVEKVIEMLDLVKIGRHLFSRFGSE